jgi:hypothetical protein
MASKPTTTAEPTPVLGVRTALASIIPHAAHSAAAAALGHDPSQLLHQIDGHLLDALAGLRQLESTTGGVGADRIRALIERLA